MTDIETIITQIKKEIYEELVGSWSDEATYAYENVIRIIDKVLKENKNT